MRRASPAGTVADAHSSLRQSIGPRTCVSRSRVACGAPGPTASAQAMGGSAPWQRDRVLGVGGGAGIRVEASRPRELRVPPPTPDPRCTLRRPQMVGLPIGGGWNISDHTQSLAATLDALRPLAERTGTTHFDAQSLYSACLSSSFVRAFEFAELSTQHEPEHAFFLVPALRAIAEDAIVLRFLSMFLPEDREMVLRNLLVVELEDRLRDQETFFESRRPLQPVLGPAANTVDIEHRKEELDSFWRNNGWPAFNQTKNRRSHKPSMRELAAKSEAEFLTVVYDFIYRLTSAAVHFNPQALLRLGWGPTAPSASTLSNVTFSSKNMNPYYLAVSQVYGAYLLCLYFDFFDGFLKPSSNEKIAVARLREHLLHMPRWPETPCSGSRAGDTASCRSSATSEGASRVSRSRGPLRGA